MNRLLVFLIVISFTVSGFGQTVIPPVFKDSIRSLQNVFVQDIGQYLKDNNIDTLALSGYLRFKIDTNGSPISIAYTDQLEEKLGPCLTKSLSNLKEAWHPSVWNNHAVQSEYLLIPISVSYNLSPTTPSISVLSFITMTEFTGDTLSRTQDSLLALVSKGNFYSKEVPNIYYHLAPVEIIYNKKYPSGHGRLITEGNR